MKRAVREMLVQADLVFNQKGNVIVFFGAHRMSVSAIEWRDDSDALNCTVSGHADFLVIDADSVVAIREDEQSYP